NTAPARGVPTETDAEPEQEELPSWRSRTIKRGDTLWDIARRYYGSGKHYPKIFKASRHLDQPNDLPRLTHPDRLVPGQHIRIPSSQARTLPKQPGPTADATPAERTEGLSGPKAEAHRPGQSPSRAAPSGIPASSTPEAPSSPDPAQHEDTSPAVSLVTGSRISISLAAALSLAMALTRLHRRRRRPLNTQCPPGEALRDPATPPAVARVNQAYLDSYTERGEPIPSDSDLAQRNLNPPIFDHITVGTLCGEPVSVPLPGLSMGLEGDGAPDAIRALATDLLANARRDRVELVVSEHHARALYPKPDIIELAADVPGITITPTFEEAVVRLEAEILRRGRMLLDVEASDLPTWRADDPAEPLPHIILIGAPPKEMTFRLNAVLLLGRTYHVGAILDGPWSEGTTVRLNKDGTVLHAEGPQADHLNGATLFHLTAQDAADMLHSLRTATGKPEVDTEPVAEAPAAIPLQHPAPPPPPQPTPQDNGTPVHLQLLGPVTVRASDQIISGLRQASKRLLAYLALHPNGVTRDQITGALWPDFPPEQASTHFHTAITTTRRILRDVTGVRRGKFILHADRRYRLERHLVDVDIWRIDTVLEQAASAETDTQRAQALRPLAGLYTDSFAVDLNDEWTAAHREYLRRAIVDALTRLAHLIQDEQPEQALDTLEQALKYDPHSEPICQSIMRLQA
uniref:LysM peptidoglycan-binding domain-containing protein n=1 Tax=Actinomadura sp. SCN-SB TaxID=3373092 RepID=UPI0037525A55